MIGLTPKQLQCWRFIQSFVNRHDSMPTLQQISRGLNTNSRSWTFSLMQALVERGYLKRYALIGYEIANEKTVVYYVFNPETKELEPMP